MTQTIFSSLLVFATLSTALVAGLVFTFSIVVMPGLAKLDDRSFTRAFQVIDGIIQGGQPLFGLVWIGSIFSLMLVSILGLWQLHGLDKWLLVVANLLYIGGVQLPTFSINVPHNNQLQTVSVHESSNEVVYRARQHFESTWNSSNNFRTVASMIVSTIMIILIYRL